MKNETVALKTIGNAVEFAIARSIGRIPESGTQPREDDRITVLIISGDATKGQNAFYELLESFQSLHGVQVDDTMITRVHAKSEQAVAHRFERKNFHFVFMPEICKVKKHDMLEKSPPVDAAAFPELLGLIPTIGRQARH